jgi:iron-regulated transporter 1
MSLEEDPTNNAPTNNVEVEDGPTSLFVLTRNDEPELGMTNSQAYNLYTSHFLSTWNVRTYEFAVVSFVLVAWMLGR